MEVIFQLLNTLYVQSQGAYLHLDHDTLKVEIDRVPRLQLPLHHLGGLVVFGNVSLSPFLIHRFAEDGRSVVWLDQNGQFRARLAGPVSGNVLLRRAQHEAYQDEDRRTALGRRFVAGKIRNARHVVLRGMRDNPGLAPQLEPCARELDTALKEVNNSEDLDEIRGIEGRAAVVYFSALKSLILVEEPSFKFEVRSKRPPRDPVNALLSFAYTLLANECISACESVGLDPQIGYLHALRPGRPALALDLMEEFRSFFADRLVLTLLNRRQITPKDFIERPGGAIYLTEGARQLFLEAYQKRKQEEVAHPLLGQKVPLGLLPHVQARLLARHLRGDAAEYAPFVAR
ncbi:type I-C CRISPR-associated endonuclease Cas1c [Thermanaeromonas sp. C210]|uniref:type I-C CRISPR-associated endonuclease Cas1c n=1 Tax=Thermanaeromonas sp. C210 TaxID=2731925 RepID=UPI00155C9D1E|nr:type I-C CRISPR-associated endonuclease Cas1c [Thermanaeromonas sp. C210]GFN22779.1 CRISPR-associated endonuclease Cas1 1 [Thermanaeromonas sp. C210]